MAQEIKRPRVAKRVVDETNETVTFEFSNGKTIVAKLAEVAAMSVRLALHGLSQKIGDAFADSKGDADVAYGWATDVYGSLKNAVWSERGVGGGEEEAPTLVCMAIAEVHKRDVAKVNAAWPNLDKAVQKSFRENPQVKAVIARIRAEREAAKAAKAAPVTVNLAVFD
jgi:hypothetical protein